MRLPRSLQEVEVGIRVYAWRVDLSALRSLVGSKAAARAEAILARMTGGPTLPGDDFITALQNWQLVGLGDSAPPEDVEALIMGRPLDPSRPAAWIRAVLTLLGLLGASISRYTFKTYRSHYGEVDAAFASEGEGLVLLMY